MELNSLQLNPFITLLVSSIILGTLATWISKKVAWKLNFLDKPKGTVPQHTKSIAYLGGIGIFVGFLIANFAFKIGMPWSFLVFAFIFMLLGLIDDKMALRPMHKFVIQVVTAVAAAKYCASFSFTNFEILDLLLSAFWYIVLLNAFNLTDVCDGLLGGITAIIMLLSVFAFPSEGFVFLAIGGSIIGFLVFNSPPASIFMGDAGSHLLGFIAAYMTLSSSSVLPENISFYILACLCAVPLAEITFLVIVRKRKGLAWWLSSKDHFALRLQRHGFSKWETDLIAYILTVISSLPMLYYITSEDARITPLIFLVLVLMFVFLAFWWYLIRIERLDDKRDGIF